MTEQTFTPPPPIEAIEVEEDGEVIYQITTLAVRAA